ncbi:MAG TPA: hypothetical protein DHV22_15285 [Xanthomarina gelatinilytica]|uniref:Uncharacterized protein n=1 Tax=Xanthomarina gelatinilytica TaxID=1137281 RepID=A0A3D6BUD6_9FLAO|nr:hypothetical protein [Xanthomarina gelatinilytica]|tara:strand:- start:628 stop:891 length:264 start_codon:yes stop_codon:yes gene_type:complete
MGGEGSMMQMIHTLRNNKSMLNKRKDRRVVNTSISGKKLEFHNTSTEKDLLEIRLKLQKERKQKQEKTILVFCVFMFVLISMFIYFH